MLKRIWTYISAHWLLHIIVLGLSLLAAGIALLQPWFYKLLIDDVFVGGEWELLVWVLLGYAGTHVLGLFVEIIRHYTSVLAGNRSVLHLRNDLIRHLRRLSLRFFYREETGRIMSVMTNDAPAMERLFQSLIPNVVMDLSYIVVMGYVIIGSGHTLLIITALLMIPFYIFFPAAISKTFRQAFREVQEKQADISAGLQSSISSTREIVAFNKEGWDEKRLGTLFTSALTHRLRSIILEARYGGIQNLASFVSPFLILAVGAPYVMRGELSVGYILAFQQWTMLLYSHAKSLYNTNQSIQQSLGAAERVVEFLNEEEDPVRLTGDRVLQDVTGAIALEDVSFSYDGSQMVLRNINLSIEAGENIALVGPSGAGKSTVFLLLMRYFDPDHGTLSIDGIDYKSLEVSSLRRHIGIVFQEPFLFSDSLYENIAFGSEHVKREDVMRVAEIAEVAPFVKDLPDGFDTQIGERGVRLSGGQKQRIAIARALLRTPKILLLDEATSALDVQSEAEVQKAMSAMMRGRTSIVIAHRLSTIRNADKIVFLKEGRIAEIGSHDELLRKDGEFARFYHLQFKENVSENANGAGKDDTAS